MSTSDRPARDEIEPGVPATTETPVEAPPGWDADEQVPPRDEPQAVDEWGTTAREELIGEPLAVRVRREEPDELREVADEGVRLYEPGAEDGLVDNEADTIGDVDASRDDTLTAEEAAMRIVDDPPGVTYDESPGYLEE